MTHDTIESTDEVQRPTKPRPFPILIGQGSYGYIHYPPLDIETDASSNTCSLQNYVSKLLTSEYATKEMNKYKMIQQVDPTGLFHLGQFILARPSRTNKVALASLDDGKYIIDHLDEYRIILMKYGGVSVRKYVNKIRADVKHHIITEQRMRDVATFWKESGRLFQGVQTMMNRRLIHHDIKTDNMVYDASNARINVIDFGLTNYMSTIREKAYDDNYSFAIFYYNMPPELYFYSKSRFDAWRRMTLTERQIEFACIETTWLELEPNDAHPCALHALNNFSESHDTNTTESGEELDKTEYNNDYSYSDSLALSEKELRHYRDFEDRLLQTPFLVKPPSLFKRSEPIHPESCLFRPPKHPSRLHRDSYVPIHEQMHQDFRQFLLHDIDTFTDFDTFLTRSMETFDLYGLGYTLLYNLVHTHTFFSDESVQSLYVLLGKMLNNNVTQRIRVNAAYQEFMDIIGNA